MRSRSVTRRRPRVQRPRADDLAAVRRPSYADVVAHFRAIAALPLLLAACGGSSSAADSGIVNDAIEAPDAAPPQLDASYDASPCPENMVLVDAVGTCMDLYEAPNQPDALPLVMYTFDEAEAWCVARDKRLCFDDEWLVACEGATAFPYPYGDTHVPGQCNDDEVWRTYNQSLLNGWPPSASSSEVDSLEQLFEIARAISANASAAADHVESLYQGEAAGANQGCVGEHGVFDLVGNVEEWTRRREWSDPLFQGNLKGRYWAESRTCQSGVRTHGNAFRFYEIGFRCCRDVY